MDNCLNVNELIKTIEVYVLENLDLIPYEILLLADPSKENIYKYIFDSEVFIAKINNQTIACYAVCNIGNSNAEIKSIAVAEDFQGKGIGTILLNHAIENAKKKRFNKIIIGTGNSSTGQLHLYQKIGFKIVDVKKDYFLQNYPEPIIENGIICSDMIILSLDLHSIS